MVKGVRLAVVLVALAGCGGDEGTGSMNPGITAGGGGFGAAGTMSTAGIGGAAGVGVGAAGAMAEAGMGGGAAGVMATAGVGGGEAGTMAAAGTGGGGAAGMGGGDAVPDCSAADASVTGSAAHAAALAVLTPMSPCGFSSCHSGGNPRAGLMLSGLTDLNMALVGKASCLVPSIPLVAPGGGNEALNNSWLWIKMTAPANSLGIVESNAAWGTAMNCGQTGDQPFGLRMPWSNSDMLAEPNVLNAVRNWICAGAPGP